jgi:hypothetical protein
MHLWLQNLIVFTAVLSCLAFVGRQAFQSLRGRKSKMGNCCSKGCTPATPSAGSPAERIVFMPVEMLSRRKK